MLYLGFPLRKEVVVMRSIPLAVIGAASSPARA
jgi:hypothetical protein